MILKIIKNGTKSIEPVSRGILIVDNKILMLYNAEYDYYEFSSGIIKPDENKTTSLIIMFNEKAGLDINNSNIKEYGLVHSVES